MSGVRRIAIAGLGAAAREIHLPAYAGLFPAQWDPKLGIHVT